MSTITITHNLHDKLDHLLYGRYEGEEKEMRRYHVMGQMGKPQKF